MVGISLVEVYEGPRRKSVISVCKQAQNGEQMHFMDGEKVGKTFWFLITYLIDSEFTAVIRM